jgi:elongation factor Ts
VAKIGENINIRRFITCATQDGIIGGYLHGTRIGVLVELQKPDSELAKDIAMHIAASKPVAISEQDVPADILEREKEIYSAQAAESGKPADIIEKMVNGRLRKHIAEITLQGQPFVKDPDISVGKLLKDAGNEVKSFYRFEVGEGIEKKDENFAEEVMAQVRGA